MFALIRLILVMVSPHSLLPCISFAILRLLVRENREIKTMYFGRVSSIYKVKVNQEEGKIMCCDC